MNPRFVDLTHRHFGAWKVVGHAGVYTFGKANKRKRVWRVRCDCGREAVVIGSSLLSGRSKGCGCRRGSSSQLRLLTLFDLEKVLGPEVMADLTLGYVEKHLRLEAMADLRLRLGGHG